MILPHPFCRFSARPAIFSVVDVYCQDKVELRALVSGFPSPPRASNLPQTIPSGSDAPRRPLIEGGHAVLGVVAPRVAGTSCPTQRPPFSRPLCPCVHVVDAPIAAQSCLGVNADCIGPLAFAPRSERDSVRDLAALIVGRRAGGLGQEGS